MFINMNNQDLWISLREDHFTLREIQNIDPNTLW